jgi:hypothetical protein
MNIATKISFLAALAVAGGCAEHTKPSTEFDADGAVRPYSRMAEVQRSNGARADGNLYAAHFTDDAVNSLGRAKLDAMLGNNETVRPVTVHMAPIADRDALLRRIESVTAYLKDNGLTDGQMHFVSGLNEASYHPSAPELANLRKMDAGEADDSSMPAAPSAGGFGGSGGILIK